MEAEVRSILSSVAADFRRSWKPLLAMDLVFKIAYFAILVPASSLLLRAFLFSQGTTVIADKDLLFLVLSPVGLLGLVVLGAVGLATVALELACLMVIGFGAARDVRVGAVDALWYAARVTAPILKLAARIVSTLLVLLAPFVAAVALVSYALLTEFDINFYLAETPPVFWLAVGLTGAILVAAFSVIAPRLISWAFALPLLLFEGTAPSGALRASADRTGGNRKLLTVLLTAWALTSLVAGTVVFAGIRLLGSWLVAPLREGRPELLVTAVGAVVLTWFVANELLSLLTSCAFSLLVVRSYDRLVESQSRQRWLPATEHFGGGAKWRVTTARLLAGVLVVGVVAVLVGVVLLNTVRIDSDVQIIAHRGAAAYAPENTLAAIEQAIADGADWVEIDVLETTDGEVVVIHDRDLMRVAGVNLAVADATYEQLRDIDVGSWFAPEFADQRVPRLADALELSKGRVRVNIELKYFGRDERLEERVVEIVEATGMESEIVVMSLNRTGVEKMRSLRPGWRVGLITAVAIGDATTADADFLAVNGQLATPLFIRSAHAAGKDVYVWPIYDPIEKARMIGRGADGLITNDPASGRRVLARMAEMSPAERLLIDVALWMGIVPEVSWSSVSS